MTYTEKQPVIDLNSIEQRLRELEDRLAIQQLLTSYSYAAGGSNSDAARDVYAEDAIYEVDDVERMVGSERIATHFFDREHQDLMRKGFGLISTSPYVVLDGDRATATCHTLMLVHEDQGFAVSRFSASRILLSRKSDGRWQIDLRQNYPLNGDQQGPDLLFRHREGHAPSGQG